jgi:radical SAM superfamily enzyme YgiQ (UPF0313 family)
MREPGNILLISCYELGHQPFSLASLLARLQKEGYAPAAVDTAVETLSDEAIRKACFVGIAVPMHTALRLGEQVATRVRQVNRQAHICFYGLYASLNAGYLLNKCIDSAIGGEYEEPLLNLLVALETGTSLDIPGVSTRQRLSKPWIARVPFVIPDRAALPPLERYAHLEVRGQMVLAGYTEATRGCKHTCLHCPITPVYEGRFFAIPANIVLADIRSQVERGAQHITFGDPDFFNGPTHAIRITRTLHQEFPDITFDATIKIEHLLKHRHLLPELRENGCAFIVSAVESLNDVVLERLAKGHTAAQVTEAFEIMEQVGIPLRPSLLPFTPWETLESYLEMLTYFEGQHLIEHIDPVHLSIRLLIPPGSAVLQAPDAKHWLRELDSSAYTYRWQHPDPRMDDLQREIAALVEQAQLAQANPVETFFLVKQLALKAAGQEMDVTCALQAYGKRKVLPHLTETWFC